MCSSQPDTAAASVEDHKVFHKNRLALGFVGHRFPCTDYATLNVFRDRNAIETRKLTTTRENGLRGLPRLLGKSDGNVAGGHTGARQVGVGVVWVGVGWVF